MPARRQLGSAVDSLALVARVMALAAEPGEDALAAALAAEACELLGLPAAAIVTPADHRGDAWVVPAGAIARREAPERSTSVAGIVARGEEHARLRGPAAAELSGLIGSPVPLDCALVLPLPGEQDPVRVLVVVGEDDALDPTVLALGLAFAAAAGAAFAHQATGLEHRRAAARFAALTRAAKTLNESPDLSILLTRICEEAAALTGSESAAILRVNDAETLIVEAAHGLPPEHVGFTLPPGAGLAGRALLAGRPLLTDDYQAAIRPPDGSPLAGIQACMAVPIEWDGELRGVISVAFHERVRLTQQDLDGLESFAELASVAFRNASVHASLAHAARTDPLTGCLNHAALHEGLAREIERAERGSGPPLSLVLIDLDYFKEVNDEHGHLIGDEVLRRVGHALRSTTRTYDLAARYGGDEFALIAVEADEEEAVEIATRAVERLTLALGDLADAGPGAARATAGVAEWSPGMTAGDLIARADRALLYGKRADRRGEILCGDQLPATFLPGRSERRDRHVPLTAPSPVLEWRPRHDEDAAERLRKRTRQLALASQLGARLSAMTDVEEIHAAVVDELHEAFGFFMCAVIGFREDGEMVSIAGRGEVFDTLALGDWHQPRDAGLIGQCLASGEPVLCRDVRADARYTPANQAYDTRSELVVPLYVDGELYGAINLEEILPDAFDDDDVRLLQTVADQVGAAMRSAALYERLDRAYIGTAEALAAALEAKDAYTADHARSIADQAEAVGRRLGMDEGELRDLRLAAVFHDIGKIAVPEAILNKPGPLTPEERTVMERHTIVGEQILAPVEFLAGVRPLVRHEHERWDGGGYPDGLAGEAIPLGSRIILACDALHAMTSDRPYRRALPCPVAHAELRRNAGTQFDARVVEALLAELGA